jgi:hypothetical protein
MDCALTGNFMSDVKAKSATRAEPTEILSHWPQLIEKLQYSPQEFYAKVEKALEDRQVPDLKYDRVEWPEGGWLSDRREYLRISRERLVFDVCGAPFGTGFFVSIWCGEKPLRLGALAIAFLAVAVLGLLDFLVHPDFGLYRVLRQNFNISYDQTSLLLLGVLAVLLIAMVIRVGGRLDMFLMGLPIIGFFYEKFFRSVTLWRVDRMCMYQQAVHAAVLQVIDEISTLQCIKPLSEFERKPVMRDLFSRAGSNGRH